ncbi:MULTISPECIES: YkgJ family cysteine cluster protein [unclassified Halanaerobium]|uniref:YkgJ family cysteine cluster protein n=1 Tax=unclassified Halanaerobium TaxID=2641197 RepID=UPI000DF4325C|nr:MULTISPECIES: YkgJ family cysteine cluster protein [unclassified Halanaerobium]RCW50460.1 hypothetical protein DFR78_10336 [Halanaerobium sp. MA284_MarDTE_T2]RCW85947.1 hypothetical protein DER71_1093 [Halanaerobium sp. DL-01]
MNFEYDIKKILRLAEEKESENREFLIFLQNYDHKKVDKIVHRLGKKYLREYDCLKCGNCCHSLIPSLSHAKILAISHEFNISVEKFKKKYIEKEIPGGYVLKGDSCPFMQEDNKCTIYQIRPEACSSFPHLYKDNINHRLIELLDNSLICPIVYYVLEELKEELLN